jgi:hypothetical protein
MKGLLDTLAGKQIRVDQTGDSSGKGRLVNIQADYASIWRDQQITHYPYPQIKSVSINITETPEIVPVPDVTFPTTFADLLETLLKKKVRIEHGDGSRDGVLSAFVSDYVSLVVNTKELTFYPIVQIKNISPYYKIKSGDPSTEGDGGQDTTGGSDSASPSSDEKNQEESKSASSNTQNKSSSDSNNTQGKSSSDSSGTQGKSSSDSSGTQGKSSSASSDTQVKSNSDSSGTRSTSNDTSPNMFNEKLASSMLNLLDATYFSSRKRSGKSTRSSKRKTRTTTGISARSPSLMQKLYGIRQTQNRK